MSMCRVFSFVVGRECLLWPVCSLGKTLLAFVLLHSVLQGQICLLIRYFLTFYFSFQSHIMKRTSSGGVRSKGLVGLHRTMQLQLLQHYWSKHRLGLLWYELFALEMNRDHSVIFGIASKYCIWDSFVDYDGYSISSKGFLPTVIDIMVIWVKFTHSSPFQFTDS